MYKHLILLVVFLSVQCGNANGEDVGTDKYAHLGIAYALQTFNYGFYSRAFGMDRTTATFFSAGLTVMEYVTWEYVHPTPIDGKDLLFNAVGQGLAIGVIHVFEF